MRKRIILPLIMSCVMAVSAGLAGCSAVSTAGPISNEYVTINKYKGLEVPVVEKSEVTDEMVQSTIDQNVSELTTYSVVDRESKEGDQVNVDYFGKVKGKAFDGGAAEGQDIIIGAGNYIGAEGKYKSFEEQLIGHKAGEKFDITVKFPENYAEELAGKVATFTITLNEVKEEVKAELNDETVKKLSESAKNVEEYRDEIKKQLETSNEESYNQTLEQEVYRELLANIELVGDVQSEIDEYYQMMYKNYENYATMYGTDMDTFCQSYMGMSKEDFENSLKDSAKDSVTFKYGCNLIAEKTNLTLSDNEFKEEATKLAEEYGYTDSDDATEENKASEEGTTEKKLSAYDQFIQAYGEEEIRDHLTQQKVMKYLVENCKQTNDATTATEKAEESTEK